MSSSILENLDKKTLDKILAEINKIPVKICRFSGFSFPKKLQKLPIVCIDKGFNLYHITYRYFPDEEFIADMYSHWNVEDLPEIGKFGNNLTREKYFGLSEYFPFYYGGYPRNSEKIFAALKYTTIRPMILIDTREDFDWKSRHGFNITDKLKDSHWIGESCIDGWIAHDSEDWLELMLFHPYKFIDPKYEELQLTEQIKEELSTKEYGYSPKRIEEENERLDKFTLYKGTFEMNNGDGKKGKVIRN